MGATCGIIFLSITTLSLWIFKVYRREQFKFKVYIDYIHGIMQI
ncbi:hypothetical protein COO91_03769 [Nostoc flagelliforme CCNUN1]|uniref:Uncharacterized protein n=1 Tax=Nostoc flagelliforme CCNUN1 TaxID=2038116 RepID=A0A2K8SQV9_9NOSO|nr:hypothetical protein COO91_03769 [Nostoc flagelliforme CCNUN1]